MALLLACERLVEIGDLSCVCELPDDETLLNDVLDGASDFLVQLADVDLGRCEASWRPCRQSWCPQTPCGCCQLYGIHLPGIAPTVSEVWIDGVQVPKTEYIVITNPHGQRVLERITDGRSGRWPSCNNILMPRETVGTFEVVIEDGYARNQLMTMAAAEIACDVFSFLAGGDHILPAGIISATAYGATMEQRRFGDPTSQESLTTVNLLWVSRFLQSLPERRGTEIMSPELDDGWELYQRE